MTAVVDIGKLEEDQAKDRRTVFGRLEVGVGAESVGSGPEIGFQSLQLVAGHRFGFGPVIVARWLTPGSSGKTCVNPNLIRNWLFLEHAVRGCTQNTPGTQKQRA